MILKKGRIIKGIGGFYYVQTSDSLYESRASRLFEYKNITPTVGDYVDISLNEDGSAYINKIYERKNLFVRPPVSNVDSVFIIASIESPEINTWLVDRMILLVRYNGMEPNIIINKYDLNEKKAKNISKKYEKSGFNTYMASIEDPSSMAKIKDTIIHESTMLMGPSGVGKSSIINEIANMDLETGDVSEKTSRGRHTTRHVEIYPYEEDSYLIDTPGFSSLSLDFIEDVNVLEDLYTEFNKFGSCKFNDCLHINEPKCAVKAAVKKDEILDFRYENYLSFQEEIMDRRIR